MKPDIISLDFGLPDIPCDTLLKKIKEINNNIPVIIISGQEDIEVAINFLKIGANDYIVKNNHTKDLLWNAILKLRTHMNLIHEVEELKEKLEEKFSFENTIIGQSEAIKSIYTKINKAINNTINVSITGETGTGVVNAFNLMDGVDGLVGTLSFVGFTMLLITSIFLKNMELATICVVFMGSILSFLRYNLSKKKKIFMGDSGSLFIGFILVTLGINLLEHEKINANKHYSYVFLLLITFFSIPVLDSIRVYLGRIKNGNSPFKADKSHLHHLFLSFGINHKNISLFIITMCMIMFFIGFGLISLVSITLIVLSILVTFIIFIKILLAIRDFNYWKSTIKKLEESL